MSLIGNFIHDETGGITLDWVVLTAVIVGTGISVLQTVSGGIENASVDTATALRGQVIKQSFESDLCDHGIEGLRSREAERVAQGGSDAVDIDHWLSSVASAFSDETLMEETARAAEGLDDNGGWSRQHTIQGLLECDAARRGLG
ncbi:hypothetical protein [Jannaschia pohangensis]|uniref:Flp pilus assembly protein, pilin Flp n=1 Tax=Jannaschia pohangensis TaxID=390807 RepID=A0A1I3NC65_9RHOB|nr:hypothetical protein SAMN04488095_2113 [Jannaschia pohangensis]